jgi:hypothetical protein
MSRYEPDECVYDNQDDERPYAEDDRQAPSEEGEDHA